MRTSVLALVAVCGALLGAGCGTHADETGRVRATLDRFERATRAHDYQTLCDSLLSRVLVARVQRLGLPCEVALQKGLGSVDQATLLVGRIRVEGARAYAAVSTSASGETPSTDTLQLVKERGTWRIAALAAAGPPDPARAPRKPR